MRIKKEKKIKLKDINGVFHLVSLDDPRYLSGKLIRPSKSMIRVKDKEGNRFQVDKKDPRYLSGELVGQNKGKKYKKLKIEKSNFGINNSIYGKIGITNKELKKRKYVTENELEYYIKDGWIQGWN